MQTVCKFTVPGAPVPWARARGGGGHGSDEGKAKQQSFYTAPAQKRAKGAVKSYGAHDMLQRRIAGLHNGRPIEREVPLIFEARVFLPIPKGFTRAQEAAAAAGVLLPAVKPDLDNWIKLPMDALEGVAYVGDGQIVGFGRSGKWYSRAPRLEVHVFHAPPPADPADLFADPLRHLVDYLRAGERDPLYESAAIIMIERAAATLAKLETGQ